jgi:periplasmic divalent cation tolerance protein
MSADANDLEVRAVLLITTVPDETTAVKIANALVAEKLAACVHALPAGFSVYRWNGKIERASEMTLLIKTTSDRTGELATAITRLHPYDLPEVLTFNVDAGLPSYLSWIIDETRPKTA